MGIILDHALNFKSHILKKITNARKAVGAIWRLGGTTLGMRGSAVRSLYTACVRPVFEYGIEIWQHKMLEGEIKKLEVMQNMALRRILGAYKTTPVEVLQKEAAIMPYKTRIGFMAARKAFRLLNNLSDTNPVRCHLENMIPDSPIGKLVLKWNKVQDEIDRSPKPDKEKSETSKKKKKERRHIIF